MQTQQTSSVSKVAEYRVKVITTADQVNMKVKDAIPQMQSDLVRTVVGQF